MLRVINVSKKIKQMQVLNNITFECLPNTILGLAGPSGSGKSTLLRCIQQLDAIDDGIIECHGLTGFMFQDFQLFPHMTVLENLVYAPKLVNQDLDAANEAFNLLNRLGLGAKQESYPQELSGGQKQRVALARSLMLKPKILLCDEPTSGLDVATIEDVVYLLQSVQRLGVTMVVASHDLDFLTKIASKIIVLKHGMIVADVEVALMQDPIHELKRFYLE